MKVIAELDGAVGVYAAEDAALKGKHFSCRMGKIVALFERGDIDALRHCADNWVANREWDDVDLAAFKALRSLASRIETLLPPRKP